MDLKEYIKQLTRKVLDENKINTHKVKLTLDNIALKKFQTIPTFKNLLYPNQLSSLKTGENTFTVNNAVYSTLQRMAGPGGYEIEKILDEQTGTGAIGVGDGPIMTPDWVMPPGRKKNRATKQAEEEGWKVTKNETTMNEAPEQEQSKGKRYIPNQFEFPEFLLKPITVGREEPRVYFKIVSKGDESVLLIDPLVAVALGGIERGRTSFDKQQDLSALTRFLSDKMPSSVRGLVKKYSTGADIQSNGFMALPLIMSKKLMSGSSTKNSIVTINDKGINVLKAIKANPGKAKGFEDELQFLIYLYKNKEVTPVEYAEEVGVSPMLASRVVNDLNKQDAVNVEAVQDTGVEGDTWYIRNPFKAKTIPGINTPLYESLKNIVKEELINEVTYHKFKNEVKFRTKNEQLHKAIREVKRKLQEIDRIVEYTSRMKQELSEGEEGIRYWRVTEKYVGQIAETINQLSNKIKNLQQ